jgi:GT2 family glycosyltransferase
LKTKLTASIVLFKNDKETLIATINSYLSNSIAEELFLIDNSPTDDLHFLKNIDKKITYIHNPSNTGFGSAHNIAIKNAIEQGSKYHLVLNPDVCFEDNIFEF